MTKEMGAYEDTLEDLEKIWRIVPSFMKFFPKEKLVHDRPSRESLGEIDLERARYLQSTDEMLEEMLSENKGKITDNMNVEFSSKVRTVCCGELVDTDRAPMAETSE